MSPRHTIPKYLQRRIGYGLLAGAAVFTILGYWMAPSTPYVFTHLPHGGYVGSYESMRECQAARRAFGSGRHLDTTADVVASPDFVDFCTRGIRSVDADQPHVSMDIPAGYLK